MYFLVGIKLNAFENILYKVKVLLKALITSIVSIAYVAKFIAPVKERRRQQNIKIRSFMSSQQQAFFDHFTGLRPLSRANTALCEMYECLMLRNKSTKSGKGHCIVVSKNK